MTTDNTNDIIIYQSPDGTTSLDVRLDHETVWLTQKQMADLFDKDSDTIGLHIRNAYKEGELQPDGTTEDSSVVQNEGTRKVRRKIRFYNLDVIISVGYRVKSRQGTQFRQWATRVLRDHIVKGYTPVSLIPVGLFNHEGQYDGNYSLHYTHSLVVYLCTTNREDICTS